MDRERHKVLLQAIAKRWSIGLNQLPIWEFAHFFQTKWKMLKSISIEFLKSWFAEAQLGRGLYKDNKLITDEFSEQGVIQ